MFLCHRYLEFEKNHKPFLQGRKYSFTVIYNITLIYKIMSEVEDLSEGALNIAKEFLIEKKISLNYCYSIKAQLLNLLINSSFLYSSRFLCEGEPLYSLDGVSIIPRVHVCFIGSKWKVQFFHVVKLMHVD